MGEVYIRAAEKKDLGAIAQVQIAGWRSTYQGIAPDAYLANLNPERQEAIWRSLAFVPEPQAFVSVAEEGFAAGGAERSGDSIYRGELYAIYLLSTH